MGWVCKFCSTNNDDLDSQCIVCDKPKGTALVCTLTAKRVRDLGLRGDVVVPVEYNVIGESAFINRTDITSVRLHEGVRKISRCAFSGCKNLSRVYSASELEHIGPKAFYDCTSLKSEHRPPAKKIADDAYAITPAKPTYTPPRSVTPPSTTRTSHHSSSSGQPVGLRIFAGLLLLGLSSIGIIPLIVWLTSSFGWTAWQWIIGLIGGLSLACTIYIVAKMFEGSFEIYSFATIMTLCIMVLNMILLTIFKEDYIIISSNYCIIAAIGTGIIARISFDERERSWGKFDVALSIINLVILVVSLIILL